MLWDKIEELIQVSHLRRYMKYERMERSPLQRGNLGRPPWRYVRRYANRHQSQSRSRSKDRLLRGHINTIFGSFVGGRSFAFAHKRRLRALKIVHHMDIRQRSMPTITFSNEDFHVLDPDQDDRMLITMKIARYSISKILIDQGSSVNILYHKTFQKMDLLEDLVVPYNEYIVEFAGVCIDTRGYVDLRTRLGTDQDVKELRVRYLLVSTLYTMF